jgi:hypothetical protein
MRATADQTTVFNEPHVASFSVFSVVQDLFDFRPADGPAEAIHEALHGPCQQTKLPDTTYGAYALKLYNI